MQTSVQDTNAQSQQKEAHKGHGLALYQHNEEEEGKNLNGNWRDEMKAEQKKKKRKKNKKKNGGSPSQTKQGEERHPNVQRNKALNDTECDNTQSTVGRNGGERFYGKNQKQIHKEDEFTPLKEKLGASFFEDQDSSEDEGMPDYKIGGYHPIHVGEILLDRYIIIQKLGWGHFSTVWLTKDLKYNNYVAMNVQKSAQHYLEAAYDEVEILDQVATNWKTEEWNKSIEEFYKDDP